MSAHSVRFHQREQGDTMGETFGARLRRLREQQGLGLRQIAVKVPCSHTVLRDYENDTRRPSPKSADRLDTIFGDGGRLAALAAPARLPSTDTDRFAYVAAHPRRLDSASVDALGATLADWRRLDDSLGAATVLPSVMATTQLVEHLVREARGQMRASVVLIGAEWLQFSGWLNTTTGNHANAAAHYNRLLEWAMEVDNANLTATALSVKGHLAWTLRDYGPMVGLSAAAGRVHHASPAVLAVAAQQQARGHALIGEAKETERMLDHAEDYAVRAAEHPDDIPPWLYFHSTALLTAQRGLAYSFLDQPDYRRKAIDHLSAGLQEIDPETRESEWIAWYVKRLDDLTALT